ncbi:MAG TPA: DNA internalization-related competence protein ComEC/Rec2, partial [Rhodocyclaceae bacterium]|nr:DNA internalization-related competence protein ComEC/Rec2 [Rhodocyclaceae bacterium]
MTLSVLGFAVGLLWLNTLPALLAPGQIGVAGAVLAMLLFVLLRFRLHMSQLVRGGVLCLLACVLGMLWGNWQASLRLADALPVALEGQDIVVSGTIAAMPQQIERGWRFDFAVDEPASIPRHISLAWYSSGFRDENPVQVPPLHAGDRWQLTVRLKRPHGNLNPYGFDYEAWLFERNIRATGYVRAKSEQRLLGASSSPLLAIERWREGIRNRFQQSLGDAPYAGVLVALAVGDQQAVDRKQWDLFARTGITHLISISGLHITMLAGLAYALVNGLWRRVPRLMLYLPAQQAAVVAGWCAACAYCLLAGFAVPAQRTLFMLAVVAIALWSRRNLAPRHVLSLALLLVLLFDPWAVLAAGFWLSFGAVSLLFYIGHGRLGTLHWLRAWGVAQWAMTLGMLPLLLLLFQQFSLVSPLANAVAIPIVSFIVTPLTLLAVIPGLEFFLTPAHAILAWLTQFMTWLAAWPWAIWQQHVPSMWAIVLAMLGMAWLLLPRGLPARWLGLVCVLPMFLLPAERPAVGELRVTTLDVGQGLAVHVQTAEHDLLFDTGPAFSEDANSGNRIILPYLRAVGVSSLDGLIISHADNDHSGGAEAVIEGMPVDWMMTSVPFENKLSAMPIAQQHCVAGTEWNWDGVHFLILHPQYEAYEAASRKSNDMSCVLKVTSNFGSVLLTADIEARTEQALLRTNAAQLRSDVLLVPHHGSRTSSTP